MGSNGGVMQQGSRWKSKEICRSTPYLYPMYVRRQMASPNCSGAVSSSSMAFPYPAHQQHPDPTIELGVEYSLEAHPLVVAGV